MKQAFGSRWVLRVVGVAAFIFTGASAPAARADLGDAGGITLSVDRFFGFNQAKVTTTSGNNHFDETRNDFTLLIPQGSTAYSLPRLAFDVGIVDHVTVGGAIGIVVSSRSGSSTVANFTMEGTSSDATGFVLAPRGGYVLPVGSSAKLWLRGGFTYFQVSSKGGGSSETSMHGVSLDLEPTFVYLLAAHVGLTVGVVVDLPLSGEAKFTSAGGVSTSVDQTTRNLGLVAGLALPL
jgi:hypothetical protein